MGAHVSAHDEPPSAYARRVQAERDEEAKKGRPRARVSFFDFSGPIGDDAINELLRSFAANQRVAEARQPPPPSRPALAGWRTALGFAESARPTLGEAKTAYRTRVRAAHPDRGGTTEKATALNLAWERARRELGR